MGLVMLALLLTSQRSQSQTYKDFDTDSLTVTTVAVDTVFTNIWEIANLKFVGCTGLIKAASSVNDTTGAFTGKPWYPMVANEILIIQKDRERGVVGLFRLRYKATSGTGALFITGTRQRSVY